MLPRVAIIILNWNGFIDTCDCVESVLRSDYPNYEIFLVDNGSQDGSSVKLKERFPQVTFVQNKENLGFAGGNNNAIKQALKKGFDYFWLLNNDTMIDNDCITILIEAAQKNGSVGLLTPLIYDFPDKGRFQHAGCCINWDTLLIKNISSSEEYLNIQDKHTICLWGTALLIKKSVIDSIGFLDEKFFAYNEDLDYCLRAIKAGYKSEVVVNTKIYHKHNYEVENIKDLKDHYFYYMARNGLWLFVKQSRGLRKVSISQHYFSKTIQKAGLYKEWQCYEAVDATLDGLYHAILNLNGAWDRSVKCPNLIKKIIMAHPYFAADLINFRLDLIISNIFKKFKQKYHSWLFYKNESERIKRLFSLILNTPSFKSNANAQVEVHSLVSHKDLYMYILAIKSFLRFYDNVSVIAHDDGTLNNVDIKILRAHIEGMELIRNIEANKIVNDILKTYPSCYNFRKIRITQRQVFDFVMFSKKNKLINLDSDTLFLEFPEEIKRWIESENHKILYIYEEDPTGPKIEGKNITNTCSIGKTPFKFVQHLCGGFVCYYKDIIDLGLVEEYCAYVIKNCKKELSSFYAQPIIALCAQNSKYTSSILPKNYQNPPYFIQDPILRHYWSSISISEDYIMDAKKVISQLKPNQ